jgi:hypothetical protein
VTAIFCTTCGTESDDQALFCDQCGEQLSEALPRVCSECGDHNRGAANFCRACGAGFEATPAAAPVGVPEPPAATVEEVAELGAPGLDWDGQTVEGPAVETPAVETPAVETPAVETPAVETPAVEAPAAVTSTARTAAPSAAAGTSTDATTRRPPRAAGAERLPAPPARPFGEGAREWAASRQADILLYLGAFLLVVAALLFVSSRGDGVSSELRVALLLVYTLGFLAAGLAARRSNRIREAGAVFLAIGALITPLNFLLIYTEMLEPRDVSPGVVWLIGSIYSALFYGVLWQRGYGRLYAASAVIATVSAWAALAEVIHLPDEWLGTWWIFFFLSTAAIADRARAYGLGATVAVGTFLSFALLIQVIESNLVLGDGGEVPLTVSLVLTTAWFALTGWSHRAPGLLPFVATSAIATGIAAMRAAGLEADWWAYSPLAMGLLAVYTRRWWAHWDLDMARFGWIYASVCGLSPLVLIPEYGTGAHGAVSFLLGAAVPASVAWRNRTGGVWLSEEEYENTPTGVAKRTIFAWMGFALLLIGVGYTQRELGIEEPNEGWIYLALSLVSIALLTRTGRSWGPALAVFMPPALAVMLVSLPEPISYPGHVAALLGVPAIALAGSFGVTRRWPITLVASVVGAFAAAAAWNALDWETWTLAATYSAMGAGLFALLWSRRRYEPESTSVIAVILSWGFVILGPIVAWGALLPVDDLGARAVVESAEYQTTLYLLLVGTALLLVEGWRIRNWNVTAAATTLAALVFIPVWNSYDWPNWTLAFAYLGVGVVRFATMTTVRTYRNESSQIPILFLSWGLVIAAALTAWIDLADRMTWEGGVAVEMVEYRAFIATVFAGAPLLLFDARRLRLRWALVSASVVAMAAILLVIATSRFDDEQAYTVPVGLYLIAFGLVVRRSASVVERHLMLHELVLLAGVATILLPQADEALQPGGADWGMLILLEGALFMLVSFVLGSRWLTVSGVLAISGVAIRWLGVNAGDTIAYWVVLGGAGMALLGLGTVMLLARDRWSALKNATVGWWRRSVTLIGVGIEWPVVLAPAAVGLIAMRVAVIEGWVEPPVI